MLSTVVLRRRGKLIATLRTFFSNRPNRSSLKRDGIVKERVFGCDLGEHLLQQSSTGGTPVTAGVSSGVPHILMCCCDAIETHGLTNGIYRLSGVASSVHRLRYILSSTYALCYFYIVIFKKPWQIRIASILWSEGQILNSVVGFGLLM